MCFFAGGGTSARSSHPAPPPRSDRCRQRSASPDWLAHEPAPLFPSPSSVVERLLQRFIPHRTPLLEKVNVHHAPGCRSVDARAPPWDSAAQSPPKAWPTVRASPSPQGSVPAASPSFSLHTHSARSSSVFP